MSKVHSSDTSNVRKAQKAKAKIKKSIDALDKLKHIDPSLAIQFAPVVEWMKRVATQTPNDTSTPLDADPETQPAKAQQGNGMPYPDFPLFAHATGRWAKKIKGRMVYFGYIKDGWEAALAKFDDQKDALYAGRKPREDKPGNATTIKELCNRFWNAKKALVDSQELSPVTFLFYERTTDLLTAHFGKWRTVEDIGRKTSGRCASPWRSGWATSRWATKFSASGPCSSMRTTPC